MSYLVLFAYFACVPVANYLIGHIGTVCVENGPCLIPVWPGVMAPSGVMVIGVSLVLRDIVQRMMGVKWGVIAIVIGAIVSYALADPFVAIASAIAFLLSETADMFVYTPIQRKNFVLALLLSASIGSVVDSVVFLKIAFGSLAYVEGQIIGKIEAVLLSIPVIWVVRRKGDFQAASGDKSPGSGELI